MEIIGIVIGVVLFLFWLQWLLSLPGQAKKKSGGPPRT